MLKPTVVDLIGQDSFKIFCIYCANTSHNISSSFHIFSLNRIQMPLLPPYILVPCLSLLNVIHQLQFLPSFSFPPLYPHRQFLTFLFFYSSSFPSFLDVFKSYLFSFLVFHLTVHVSHLCIALHQLFPHFQMRTSCNIVSYFY